MYVNDGTGAGRLRINIHFMQTVTVRLIITKVNQSAEVVLKAGLF